MNKKSGLIKKILTSILAVIGIITALFILWWKGVFLPSWINWNNKEVVYYNGQLNLNSKSAYYTVNGDVVWKTDNDWFVQDMLIEDVDRDGMEEVILLFWRHGSFGEHKPFWIEKNDINLKQHIGVFKFDESRDNRIRTCWVASEINYEIDGLKRGGDNRIIVNKHNKENDLWEWQVFGFKLLGPVIEKDVNYVAVGDNLIHPWLLEYGDKDYDKFYSKIKSVIENADIASVNQETVFVDKADEITDYPRFGTPSSIADCLKNAGFDVFSMATNHMYDKGDLGIEFSANYLDSIGVIYTGINPENSDDEYANIKYVERNSIKFALLSYTYGTNGLIPDEPYIIETFDNKERIVNQIKYAKERSDVVIVYAHWGDEYSTKVNDMQKEYTDLFFDNEVDVVIGTHPHVLQDYELIDKDGHQMLVYYSLGNFVSGQDRPERIVGGLADFTVKRELDGSVVISDYTFKKVITHQGNGECIEFLLDEYPYEKRKANRIVGIESYLDDLQK